MAPRYVSLFPTLAHSPGRRGAHLRFAALEVVGTYLLDKLPQASSLHHFRQVLVHTGVLPERVEYLERITPWPEQLLAGLPSHHARLIRPFAHWFVLRRARRTAHRRSSYTQAAGKSARHRIQTAVEFLGWLDEHGLARSPEQPPRRL